MPLCLVWCVQQRLACDQAVTDTSSLEDKANIRVCRLSVFILSLLVILSPLAISHLQEEMQDISSYAQLTCHNELS